MPDPHGQSTTSAPRPIALAEKLHSQKPPPSPPSADGTTYQACHYMCAGSWGEDLQLRNFHVDYAHHDDILFVLREGQWAPAGALHIDVDCYVEGEGVSLGRFRLSDGFVGAFEGPWVWNYGARRDGRGEGTDVGNTHEVKLSFLLQTPPDLPAPPPRPPTCPPIPGYEDVSYLTLFVT